MMGHLYLPLKLTFSNNIVPLRTHYLQFPFIRASGEMIGHCVLPILIRTMTTDQKSINPNIIELKVVQYK